MSLNEAEVKLEYLNKNSFNQADKIRIQTWLYASFSKLASKHM